MGRGERVIKEAKEDGGQLHGGEVAGPGGEGGEGHGVRRGREVGVGQKGEGDGGDGALQESGAEWGGAQVWGGGNALLEKNAGV